MLQDSSALLLLQPWFDVSAARWTAPTVRNEGSGRKAGQQEMTERPGFIWVERSNPPSQPAQGIYINIRFWIQN